MARKKRDDRGGAQGPPNDNFQDSIELGSVPGEVIIKLSSTGIAKVTASLPTGPSRGLDAAAPSLTGNPEIDAVLAGVGGRAIFQLHPRSVSTSPAATEAAAEVADEMIRTIRVRIDADADIDAVVARLRQLPDVDDAEANVWRMGSATPNDPSFASQWGLTKIKAPEGWDCQTGSRDVIVAVVDSGIDLNHPDLVTNLVPGYDMVDLPGAVPPAPWMLSGDFITRDSNPQDEQGHGTHVAGIIGASTNNGTGVAGVAWSCRLMSVRAMALVVNRVNGRTNAVGSAADIAAAVRYAVDHGARVINLSLGSSMQTFVERDAIAYAVRRDVVVVAAMGNDFARGNATSYPAAYPGVLAVGAVDQFDKQASFSSTGPHIGVVAPGVDVLSTYLDDTYAYLSGTSMATPFVSGLAALLRSCSPSLKATEVITIIKETAVSLRDNPADPVPNNTYGYGRIDVKAALERAGCCNLKLECPLFGDKRTIILEPCLWFGKRTEPLCSIAFPRTRIIDLCDDGSDRTLPFNLCKLTKTGVIEVCKRSKPVDPGELIRNPGWKDQIGKKWWAELGDVGDSWISDPSNGRDG
jgi:subtilisin family serine protease